MDHVQLSIQTFLAIMAEKDAAIQERNLALEERNRAFAERDMALLQREAALEELNTVTRERDEAIAALRFRSNFVTENLMPTPDLPEDPGCGSKSSFGDQEVHQIFAMPEDDSSRNEPQMNSNASQVTDVLAKIPKPRKRARKATSPKPFRMGGSVKINSQLGGNEENPAAAQLEAREDQSGLNEVTFDELANMPIPVCSCTGLPQPCYKWGDGGWQSACCTNTMSMYPLPQVPNKQYRVGGRKMTGAVFTKLIERLASEGHDFSTPIDLKDHWSKHGTNRYGAVK